MRQAVSFILQSEIHLHTLYSVRFELSGEKPEFDPQSWF